MKFFALIMCLLGLGGLAEAAPALDRVNPYATVADWYKQGTAVKFSEIKRAAYEGQCFSWHEPHNNELYVLAVTVKKTNDTPIYNVNLYDSRYRKSISHYMKNMMYEDDEYESDGVIEYNEGYYGRGAIRRYGKYFVTVLERTEDTYCVPDQFDYLPLYCTEGEVIKADTPVMACYFYNKIR